jgi:hypothetical protein
VKYLLIAIIFTSTTVDHGASIQRELGIFHSIEECEQKRELMKSLYVDGSIWMAPNQEPERIARVSYACLPQRE